MLHIVGLGLSIASLSLEAVYRLASCDTIVVDAYTSSWFPSLAELAEVLRALGKRVVIATRAMLEGAGVKQIIEAAKKEEVCLAVPGDPLIATTHIAIVIEAKSQGVEVSIVPGLSIVCAAISLSGLQAYKLGKIVTVVRPKEGIVFEYPLHVIAENRARGLHTLLLLEMDAEKGYYMTPPEAAKILLEVQEKSSVKPLDPRDPIIVIEALGSDKQKLYVKSLEQLLAEKPEDYRNPPYTLIIPSKDMHPVEREAIAVASTCLKSSDLREILDLFKELVERVRKRREENLIKER